MVQTGLDRLQHSSELQNLITGNIGYLCHGASVDHKLTHGATIMQSLFGSRLKKLFGPQHGFVTDVQDNMVETEDYIHPHFNLIVHSLYSQTRIPTPEMLKGIDTLVVDLQDVGTRIYTYIYTLSLCMKACGEQNIKVVVLDRPNPIGGKNLEGNVLKEGFTSFVGMHALPVRHGLTMGEFALMARDVFGQKCDLEIIKMDGWKREMSFEETLLPWVLPSPNLPNIDGAYTFVGTVLFEGTNISEGRGTTRSLEIIGHPKIEAFSFKSKLDASMKEADLSGFELRPLVFLPTFQKHQGVPCGGYQIHITDRNKFQPWRVSQILCRDFYHELGDDFKWKEPPYEYEYHKNPIDLINGCSELKTWVEENGKSTFLDEIEREGLSDYSKVKKEFSLY